MTTVNDRVEAQFTGITWDGGRTSLPYAVWHLGRILRFCVTRKDAEGYYKEAMAGLEETWRERRRRQLNNGYSYQHILSIRKETI